MTTVAGAARRARAVEAACAIGRRHGLRVTAPRILDDCTNTVVHLAPSPFVAKVCATARRPSGPYTLAVELDIARHLVSAGAPIAAPCSAMGAVVWRYDDHALTFWRYHKQNRDERPDPRAAATALWRCHEALGAYQGALPSFLERQVVAAGRALVNPDALTALPAAQRAALTAEHTVLCAALARRDDPWRLLHGDPHRRNFLVTSAGCLMIDFESACAGPVEWDLSALADGPAGVFPSVDAELLRILRRLRRVCVTVWWWRRPRRTELAA